MRPARRTASATSGCTPVPAGSTESATRIGRGGVGPSSGAGIHHGSRSSPRAIAARATRRSATRRASGPWVDISWPESGRSAAMVGLKAGTRPKLGRMPAIPQA
jgi:hypothetical protein